MPASDPERTFDRLDLPRKLVTLVSKHQRTGSVMKRREFIALISLSAAWPTLVQAQQQPTLGLLLE
jgi:hypothetical protein